MYDTYMQKKIFFLLAIPFFIVACGNVEPKHPAAVKCNDMSRERKFECYRVTALEEKSTQICGYIIDAGFRVTCKKQLAIQECDKDYCKSIIGDWRHPSCFEAVDKACNK